MLSKTEISATELQAVAERIKSLRQKATEHAVEIGRELLRVKESLPHGVFVRWVEKACEFKIRTAQDLMKLAREVDSNAQLVALMVPSTLRVYLSKTTPPAVRSTILRRLQNGERVSRNDLQSAVSATRPAGRREPAAAGADVARVAGPDLLVAGETRGEREGDRSRQIADLLVRRLTREDYDYVMDGMTWGIWNRVFVWMRAARLEACEKVDAARARGRAGAAAPAATFDSP